MKVILRIFANKYLLALTAFCVWMAFFDARDIFSQMARRRELQQLNTKIEYYNEQIKQTKEESKNLRDNAAAKEKYAREKYFMKKDNEEIFIEQ
jgi:cell division protein DivIC